MTPSPLMTAREACQYLRVSRPTLARMVHDGTLPVAIDSPLRIPRADVEALARGERAGVPAPLHIITRQPSVSARADCVAQLAAAESRNAKSARRRA